MEISLNTAIATIPTASNFNASDVKIGGGTYDKVEFFFFVGNKSFETEDDVVPKSAFDLRKLKLINCLLT